jgi:hypothetical protein
MRAPPASPSVRVPAKEHEVNNTDEFPGLSEKDLGVFGLFCERALTIGNLNASINIQDVASDITFSDLGGEIRQSLVVLMDKGYLHRSGYRQYAITPTGFQSYARSNIADFGDREDRIKDAVAAVEQTDTNAVVASTGDTRQVVNHVLRLLQRNRDIGGFVTESDSYCVTRVSPAFRKERATRKAAE